MTAGTPLTTKQLPREISLARQNAECGERPNANVSSRIAIGVPSKGSSPITGTIYRRVSRPPAPITNVDFYSGKEKNDKGTDRLCQRWGTSVWIDINHLKHDMDAIAYLRKYRFVSVDISARHGVIQKTYSENFSGHHTFWRDYSIDFAAICNIVYEPD